MSYLVPRLYEASDGTVRFAGDDVRDLRQESLISHIGIVSQETYLFHASIGENLRYAKPDATDAELEAAARAANIHETIASFPRATTPWWVSAATACPAARSSASRSHACC